LPIWIPLLLAAPFIGSFLGVVVTREADFTSIARGRSRCDSCGVTLAARDLIPIASFLALGGRCRVCKARISLFYPAIELAAVVPVAWAAPVQHGPIIIASAVYGWMLIALSWIDWRSFRLPDVLTLPLLGLGLAFAAAFDSARWLDHAIGALAALFAFTGLALLYRLLRGREGLGFGDAKLAGAIGAFVGWQAIPVTLLLSALFGLVFFILRALLEGRWSRDARIPFGPFLAAAGWITWLYGPLLPGFTR